MKYRQEPVPQLHLVALALISLLVFMLAEHTADNIQQPRYRLKIKAAQLAVRAQDAMKEEMSRRGLRLDDRNDPWHSGLIGEERTVVTSDRGVSTAKILATNPNFAAALIDLLYKAGVHKGDTIAVGLTGSIPGWNVALYAACQAMSVTPYIIASVAASDWGANRPDITWLDMETLFKQHGIFGFKTIAASVGGGADIGRGISPAGRDLLHNAISRNSVPIIEGETLESIIDARMKLYDSLVDGGKYAAYVNVGGGLASLGGALNSRLIPAGYSRHLKEINYPVRAVVNRMAERDVPIINLSDVVKIADRFDLPTVVGTEPPEVGQGSLFYSERYNITWTIVLTALLGTLIFAVIRLDLKYYLGRRPRKLKERPEAI
jgi:poly-gamma-glutamate system protein